MVVQRLTLTERFEFSALQFILESASRAKKGSTPDDDASRVILDTLEPYITKLRHYCATGGPDGVAEVNYKRSHGGHGRFYADFGLQGMPKSLRNTLAHMHYDDIDFRNCQPSLLWQYCDRSGVPCPLLRGYCEDREAHLNSLLHSQAIANSGGLAPATNTDPKTVVLAVINGGSSATQSVASLHPPAATGSPCSSKKCALSGRQSSLAPSA
jgi:hypothetical protein